MKHLLPWRFLFLCAALPPAALANSGGYVDGSGEDCCYIGNNSPSGSTVTIDEVTSGSVYGGKLTSSGSVTNNSVTVVNGGEVTSGAYGGYLVGTSGGTVSGNTLTITGGTVGTDRTDLGGGVNYASSGDATNNSVLITGGTVGICVNDTVNGTIIGGHAANGTASGNTVTVTGGTVGNINAGQTSCGDVTNNTVTITGGTVIGNVSGGDAQCSNATGNAVTISGGTVIGKVIGGVSAKYDAMNNTVTISGNAVVNGNVYGGCCDSSGLDSANGTGNTVILVGTPTITGTVYGGESESGANNTLEVHGSRLRLKNVSNFTNYNFFLPSTVKNGDTILMLTEKSDSSNGDSGASSSKKDISNATVAVTAVAGGASPLRAGDKITLINAAGGLKTTSTNGNSAKNAANTRDNSDTSSGVTLKSSTARQGVSLDYDFALSTDANNVCATVSSVRLNPQTKVFAEGWLGGAILALQGADLVAGTGMTEAVKAGATADSGVHAFASVSGGSLRYDTGSHVDMKSFSLMAGASKGWDGKHGHVTLGGFVEYGNGSYDTYNSFSDAASAGGDGTSWYTGAGLLSRMDFAKSGALKNYLEASARLGRLSNDYGSDDLRDASGQTADYDAYSTYASFHIGAGTVFTLSESVVFDFYGKYFYTWLEAERTTLSTGERLKFEDVESSRLRIGTRVHYDMNASVKFYAGAAWEYEFDGDVDATVCGYDIDEPTTQGNTGIGEIGVVFKPVETLPLTIDLGIQGYVGKREGATGSLNANFKYKF